VTSLQDIVTMHHARFAAMAAAWLADGAARFEVWGEEHVLAAWPPSDGLPSPTGPVWSAPIEADSLYLGALRVVGVATAAAAARLTAEASLVAHIARLEIEQESMVAELIETQDQLLAVYDLTQSECYHSYYTEVEQLLCCLARQVVRLLKVEGGFVLLSDQAGSTHLTGCHDPLNRPLIEHLLTQCKTVEHDMLINRETGGDDSLLPEGVDCFLFVPMAIRNHMRVGLGMMNKAGGFASPDLKLVRAIAEQSAARIENFLLHQETIEQARLQTEMQMARQVQHRLLQQHLPDTPDLDMYADWRPALQASGDFYDFIVRPDRPFIFTVGDVSGKGMPAALLTVEALTELRSQTRLLLDPVPADVMRFLNAALYNDLTHAEMMATVFIGQYEPSCRELRYANAGHAPVIYCPAAGEPTLLQADDPVIGVLPTLNYQHRSLTLWPGDVLVVATDGFNESFNAAGEMFGYQRMLDVVGAARELTAPHIAARLFEAVDQFAERDGPDQSLDDDQAIIVLKGMGEATEICTTRSKMMHVDVPATPDYLDVLRASVAVMLENHGPVPHDGPLVQKVTLAVHELCANIMQHAYAGRGGILSVTLTYIAMPPHLIIETYDTGQVCNPSLVPDPDLLGEGGRGLYLLRTLMDEVIYHAASAYAWQSGGGSAWQPYNAPHPQPGHNYWRMVTYLENGASHGNYSGR
jgi:phosphoserine phosphatase RsbU/P